MKQLRLKWIVIAMSLLFLGAFYACKSKSEKKEEPSTMAPAATDTTSTASSTAPVEISPDEALRTSLKDATKDYPTVTATVNNGEVTLTGTLERAKLQKLMQSIQSLNPKKVINQLTLN
jgi:hypothetical protein